MTSISDERGEELLYAGMPISDVFKVQFVFCFITVLCIHNVHVYRMTLELVGCLVYCGSKEGRCGLHLKSSYSSHAC